MRNNLTASTAQRAPYPIKRGIPLMSQAVLLASLSLGLGSAQVAANPQVNLPPIPPGLGVEFRCENIPGFIDDFLDCPLQEDDTIALQGPGNKYLQFTAVDPACTDGEYTPLVTNVFTDGIGVMCSDFTDFPGIGVEQQLDIAVKMDEGSSSSTLVDGIYLNNLDQGYWNGESCEASASGVVLVDQLDDQGNQIPGLVIPWTSDDSQDGGEGGEGGCAADDGHAIFVDFGGTANVTGIQVQVDNLDGGEGPVAAGLAVPNVNPDCFEEGDGECVVDLVGNPLPGQDMTVIVADDDLFGNVTVLDGFPVRVLDPRASCQATPSGLPELLEFNNVNMYTYYPAGSDEPGDVVNDALPLIVSDDGSTLYLTLSEKGCGTPRMMFNGPAVARGTPGSMPFIDIIAIESDIDPVDSLILFESENESPYECKPGPVPAPLPPATALDQPLGEINSRADEVKQLAGVPGIVDPVSRDKTQACGSRRVGSQRFSFVGYSLIHNLQTDMRAELSDEVQVLADTVTRTADCVSSSFYYGQLAAWPIYIRYYYDLAVDKAVNQCNAAEAGQNFVKATVLVNRFRNRLLNQGSSEFLRCYASGSNLDEIKESPPMALAPGDKPLNAYGDIITQLQHLSYGLKTFRRVLKAVPDSCP
ncbi:MAG: hypothetical protein KDI14_08855 [Halioglobus sp.]|nr:hypothetical protein [Halioglobus sp.]